MRESRVSAANDLISLVNLTLRSRFVLLESGGVFAFGCTNKTQMEPLNVSRFDAPCYQITGAYASYTA